MIFYGIDCLDKNKYIQKFYAYWIEKYVKVKTPDIVSGDKLPVLRESTLFDGSIGSYDDGFFLGWVLGDGWITERGDNGKLQTGMVVSLKDAENGVKK